jgi:hypothetical protein
MMALADKIKLVGITAGCSVIGSVILTLGALLYFGK